MTGKPRGGPAYGPPRDQAPTFSPFSPGRPAGPWGPGLPGSPLKKVNKPISKKLGRSTLTHCPPSRTPRPPHRKSRVTLFTGTNAWSWGTLGKNSGSGDSHETQPPSHPQDTWLLTYLFPTITFVTLEDRYEPMTCGYTEVSEAPTLLPTLILRLCCMDTDISTSQKQWRMPTGSLSFPKPGLFRGSLRTPPYNHD